jgi:hypothetical protein
VEVRVLRTVQEDPGISVLGITSVFL